MAKWGHTFKAFITIKTPSYLILIENQTENIIISTSMKDVF